MSKPLISIVMSVYNDSAFLYEALDSVLRQSYQDWEFVIVDDSSTDNSVNIINSPI